MAPTDILLVASFLLYPAFLVFDIRTPRWVGYIVQRPEAHGIHHANGVHAYNYSDFLGRDVHMPDFRLAGLAGGTR